MEISNFNKDNIIRNNIGHGAEGIIHLYNDNGTPVALKIFHTGEEYDSNDNKELKIIILKNESILKNDIKLLNRVYHMGKFIGFTSIYEPYTPISFIDKKDKKIKFLNLLLDRVQELNSHGIYIGDFYTENFGFEDDRVKLYDIDNFRIDNLDFNITDPTMVTYLSKCNNIQNIDYFCFNWFALSLLSRIETEVLLRGNFNGVPKELKTEEILDFYKKLRYINDSYTIEKGKDGKPKTLLNLIK